MDPRSEAAFAEFMRGRWPVFVRLGYGLTGDQRLGEDLARAALAKAYASWPRVLRAGEPDVYVRRVMLNASQGRLGRRGVRGPRPDAVAEPGTAPQSSGAGDRPALLAALMRLPAAQRSVVLLRYWMDMTETEVAATLGCSVGSVKSQAARALAELRVGEDLAEEMLLWVSGTSGTCVSSSLPSLTRSRRRMPRSAPPSGGARSFRPGGASASWPGWPSPRA